LALADYVPTSDEATWTESHRAFVAQQLVSSNAEFQPILREALRPIQDKLLSDLERIFGDSAASEAQRLSAANALADYAANDLGRLTQWLTLATPEQHAVLYPLVSAVPSPETIAQLSEVAATPPPEDLGSVPRIAYGQRRANAAVTMLKLGEKEKVLPVFDWTDDPEAMTQFIFRCKPRGIRVETLLDSLDKVANAPVGKYPKDTRYALILSIGEYSPDEIPATRRDTLVNQLSNWYAHDPSSGVHGAAGWLLRHLGAKEIVAKIDQTPVPFSPKREWFNLAITVTPTAAENINSSVVAQQPAKRSLNSDEEPLILSSGDNPVDKTQLPLPGEKNSWLAVDSSLVTQIQSAEGFITDNFGLCQSLPLVLFIRLSEDLRPSGYRPIRIRPYLKTNDVEGKLSEVLVAAIWTRDGGEWLVQMDLSAEEIREQNELLSQKGMIVLDVAGYPSESPKGPTDKYIGIWASSKGSKSDLLVGVSDVEHDAAWKAMKQRGFSVRTRQCFRGVNGQIMHAQVWCSPADQQWEFWVGDRAFYESKLSSQTVLADVCVFDRRTTDPMSKQQPEQRYAFVFNSSARGVVAKECHDLTPSQHLTVCRSLESEGFRPISLSVSLIGGDYKCASIWHRSIPPRTFYYTFIVFPAGSYEIGSVADQPDRQKNEMRHSVTLTRPFALLDREITFEELIAFSPFYAGIMKQLDAQPKDAGFGADWYDSVAYSRWLGNAMGLPESDQCYADPETLDKEKYTRDSQVTWAPRNWPLGLDKRGFRLPTESEWEVLARSGSRTAYGFGSEVALLDRFGWFADNSGKHVHPGRELRPSLRGLFDLHGNLFEWTHDCYGDFGESTQTDPLGAQSGSLRVLRGGGWNGAAANCRAAFRYSTGPTFRMSFNGFRLALSSPFGVSRPAEQGQGPGAEPAGVGTEGASAEQRPEMP
jgi:formylglycine-generating enzyme required for sulfatase activity